ncbi:hypothetical protein [Aurantimonas sp. 22II-16-19i]|uniref:hypothetical protein n=1 Tax=Aurantimonas sp. 22II-16-19i TaxID=1317114 RepID=UPI0009F7DF2E|nr:hypothetical protein [Aurantimonas sp. 22II-16-19i]ORE98296.1 hypothetical protein ATO4_04912 [Aurantimonas sp. 22II-16-19i]
MSRRFAVLVAAVLTCAAVVPGTAQTSQPAGPAAEDAGGLSGLILPYTPYLFDFAVTSLRSLAAITYDGRRYDPITRSLVVTGLEVGRDKVNFRIGQMRVGADQLILDDVAVDTRPLPLDPTVREVLTTLDRQTVTGNVTVGLVLDAPRADYQVQASARLDGIGAFDLDADLRGFHLLAPLDDIGGGPAAGGDRPEIRGRLASGDLAFVDMGLVPALYDVLGREQGLSPDAAAAAAALIAGAGTAGLVDKLPGGATPQLRQRAQGWSAAVQAFLRAPDRLFVALRPAEPFDLARLTDGAVDARDVEDLAPEIVNGPATRQPLLTSQQLELAPDAPLEDVLALADVLLKGRGTPQDAGRALGLIMPAAMEGNRAAVALLARAIAIDPYVPIAQERLAPTYVALDLALAEGLPGAGESLAAIGRRLSPAEIVGAEDEAVATWRETPVGQRQRAAEIEAFRSRDWATIRRLAYAYYEGSQTPRNIMRAYGWAAIAAAGGDRVAAKLRDELTRAAGSGKLVLPLERARQATDDLWARILGDEGAAAAGENGPAGAAGGDSGPGTGSGTGEGAAASAPSAPPAAPPSAGEPTDNAAGDEAAGDAGAGDAGNDAGSGAAEGPGAAGEDGVAAPPADPAGPAPGAPEAPRARDATPMESGETERKSAMLGAILRQAGRQAHRAGPPALHAVAVRGGSSGRAALSLCAGNGWRGIHRLAACEGRPLAL